MTAGDLEAAWRKQGEREMRETETTRFGPELMEEVGSFIYIFLKIKF